MLERAVEALRWIATETECDERYPDPECARCEYDEPYFFHHDPDRHWAASHDFEPKIPECDCPHHTAQRALKDITGEGEKETQ